jgi:hypothetical protein
MLSRDAARLTERSSERNTYNVDNFIWYSGIFCVYALYFGQGTIPTNYHFSPLFPQNADTIYVRRIFRDMTGCRWEKKITTEWLVK